MTLRAKCVKCGKLLTLERCGNCGCANFERSLGSMGATCKRCQQNLISWNCSCGCQDNDKFYGCDLNTFQGFVLMFSGCFVVIGVIIACMGLTTRDGEPMVIMGFLCMAPGLFLIPNILFRHYSEP